MLPAWAANDRAGVRGSRTQAISLIVDVGRHPTWGALVLAVCLWFLSVGGHQLGALRLGRAPFLELGLPFWAGLACAHLVLLAARSDAARYVASLVIAGYFWLTIPVIFPLGYMHDSARNVVASARSLYPGGAFPGFTLFARGLIETSGVTPQAVDRFFPALAFLVYTSLLAGLCCRLRQLMRLQHDIGPLVLYAMAVLGSAFNLRLNAAPQTLGYMLFLYVIVLLLKPDDPRGSFLSVLALIAMVISHPISPLLAVAGLYGILYLNRRFDWRSVVPSFVMLALVVYTAWVMYRAGWVLTSAIRILRGAAGQTKPIPIAGFHAVPRMATYLLIDHVLLAGALAVLLAALLLVLHACPRIALACLLWGALLTPVFALLYGSHDFLDRVLLFAILPAVIVFAVAYTPVLAGTRLLASRRLALGAVLITLGLLSAATSYFYTADVDRVTAAEIAAQHYVARTTVQPADIGGFQLPLHFLGPVLMDDRGTADGRYFRQARIVVVLQQARNAALMREGGSYRQTRLGHVERRLEASWNLVYDDGQDIVYAR